MFFEELSKSLEKLADFPGIFRFAGGFEIFPRKISGFLKSAPNSRKIRKILLQSAFFSGKMPSP